MPEPSRILALIGSGETAPSMARVHRELLDRLGPRPVPAVMIDTPYGFQENAADLTAGLVAYFAERVRNPISVASFRASGGDPLERLKALARVCEADYVFSGPGSPSYALRQWAGTEIPTLLADKMATGGVMVMASAAALTLGRLTVPVYEIYKVGEDPHWLSGLDLLSAHGLPVAVIPHFDNAEGRGHDTRFCFLGERRLGQLESEMPDDTFILGIDEHTTLMLDLASGQASVLGRGAVTVRHGGRSTTFAAGAELTIEALRAAAFGPGGWSARAAADQPPTATRPGAVPGADAASMGLSSVVADCERRFRAALARNDLPEAIRAVLVLDDLMVGGPASARPGVVEAHLALRSMIARLAEAGSAATTAAERQTDLVRALLDIIVELRLGARTDHDWPAADTIRELLRALGVELHDSAEGTSWTIQGRQAPPDGKAVSEARRVAPGSVPLVQEGEPGEHV